MTMYEGFDVSDKMTHMREFGKCFAYLELIVPGRCQRSRNR
jgi:hypothetical protein